MTETHVRPVLAKQEVRELVKAIPSNVWIQGMTFEANRITRNDDKDMLLPGFDKKLLDVRQAYPNFYIPMQTVTFNTPLMRDHASFQWEDFVKALAAASKLCTDYRYRDSNRRHTDEPLSDRLFIKELLLVEAQASHPKYHDVTKKLPVPWPPGDSFYDGLPCTFATFAGTYQLLGEATDRARDGVLPGQTHKTMNLVELQVVRTKHVKQTLGHAMVRFFARGKEDMMVMDEKRIVNHPEYARQWLPSCCQAGVVQELEISGEWKDLSRFRCDTLLLKSLIEEEQVGE